MFPKIRLNERVFKSLLIRAIGSAVSIPLASPVMAEAMTGNINAD